MRILIVDDEELNRELLTDLVEMMGHEVECARDGFEALAAMHLDIDVVLLDIMMPGMDGFEVAGRIREDDDVKDVPIIMVTALDGKEERLRAVEAGANDWITKPVDKTELHVRLGQQLRMKEAQDVVRQHQQELEQTVDRRTRALRKALEEQAEAQRKTHEAHLDTIYRLVLAAEYRDKDTALHIQRMSQYSALLARRMHLPPSEVDLVLHASPMHDVGKLGVPDSILLKPGKLTEEEWRIMRQHTVFGAKMLENSPSDLLQAGEKIALAHHEKWNGSGYPHGTSGQDIPLHARICAVADVFDALTSRRPYKEPFSVEETVKMMTDGSGKDFDPDLLHLFVDDLDEVHHIKAEYSDDSQTHGLHELMELR